MMPRAEVHHEPVPGLCWSVFQREGNRILVDRQAQYALCGACENLHQPRK